VRLHSLEVQALQAFGATEVVDFDALGAAGLFLLHGDTGAGKTTLLDAICFAFFGRLPGARGKDARERSDHAPAELQTRVVLEATLRGERLRITRTPRQERPKRRGSGTTEEAATVLLERFDAGRWRTLATRHDEAGEELDRLLGMNRDQFCQVVLLPQGEFATFLRADSDARWEVLERLFATRRFSVAEDVLKQRRIASARELDAARGAVRDVAQRLCQEVGCEAEDAWEDDPARLAPWLQERLVGAEASLITAGSVCSEAAAARAAADAALRAADERADRARRHAEAVAAVAAYVERRPERDAAADELFAAREASGIAPLLEEDTRLEVRAHAAERAAALALEALGELTGEPDRLRQEAARLRAQAGEAGGLAEVEAALDARDVALEEELRRAADAEAEGSRLQEQLTSGPARGEQLTREYDAARTAAAALPDRVAAAQDAHRRREAADARDRLAEELERLAALRSDAIGTAQDARQHHLDVRAARLDGMAAELARALAPGEACLVCGATEHPAPAAGDGAGVDADAERQAQDAHETAEARVRSLESRLTDVRAQLAAQTALAGTSPRAELVRTAAAADRVRDAARRASTEVATYAERLQAFTTEQRELAARRAACAETAAGARARAAAWRAGLDADRGRLATALDGAPSVEERVRALCAAAGEREHAADALAAAAGAREAAGHARERVLEAARAAGFSDLGAARAAVRPTAACAELEERLRAFDDGLAERRGLVADPELQAAASAEPADLDALRAAARAAAEAEAQAERDHEVAQRHARGLRALEAQLDAALDALAPVAEHARHVRELATLVDGSAAANRKKMRLSAYVLAARLEEIAAAATIRLQSMTDGRYTIEHSDAGARGQKRGGLDLRIVDGWTGRARHPSTLSGGETFLASLALALGLADVVAAETGGARLETLFVDEGFGSLDPASLDLVLDVLDRLRDGGRAVGIVSHVAELRQRIPAQLHVVKGRAGSHVAQPVPAA
jgi:exonuclease SbcC